MPFFRIPIPFFCILTMIMALCGTANGQSKYINIPLPVPLQHINQEFSGMAQLDGRIYLLPQYGNNKETRLDGDFNIYSLYADSINRVIAGADTALKAFRTIKVRNLAKLPAYIKKIYQGFETLTFIGNKVYMAIETVDTVANCYILRGLLDTVKNEIEMDAATFLTLKRPFYISNAGYESITWLPQINKLIAFYEFNAAESNTAYLIDTTLTKAPEPVKTPFLYFRNTDAVTAPDGGIYAINYFWDGEYSKYLDNDILKNAESGIKRAVTGLKDSLKNNPAYLKTKTFARIVHLKNYRKKRWKEVAVFDGFKKNWEGLTLFKKGALIVTDANRSAKQVTLLAYVEF